jgi:hypothetical protein
VFGQQCVSGGVVVSVAVPAPHAPRHGTQYTHHTCLIKGAFVGEKNFDVIKMHGTTIQILKNSSK